MLPHPQRAKYGAGYLPLKGMEIQFTSTPSPEDQFAARELSQALGAKCTCVIPTEGLSKSKSPVLLLRRTGPIDALPGADDRPGPDSRESYSIRVTPRGAEIRARTSAGLFYGVQTLRQMVEMHGREAVLPEVEIEDWPSLAYRGFMMDMSHGPLPTEEEVKRQIDFLARWKANQYYFYSEASIQLHGYPLLNPGARFTQEEVRRIIAYARERHIDVVPCVEPILASRFHRSKTFCTSPTFAVGSVEPT
ncbi:MAG: glycoside hydrolase family 20 zincin-like fold domain-containing protein [Terriglobia bacterium]